MTELTPRDVDRLTRELVDRLGETPPRPGEDYHLHAARIALLMAEYPAAVVINYTMMALDQVLRGEAEVRTTGHRRRR